MGQYLLENSYRRMCLDEDEEYESTIAFLTEELERNPKISHGWNNRGLAYWESGKQDEAFADFAKAIEVSSGNAVPFMNRAEIWERLGETTNAIDDFSSAISICGDDPTIFRCRAFALVKCERFREAIEDFSRAIELEPDFGHTYLDRGNAYKKLGQDDLAAADFDTAKQCRNGR